MHAFVRHFIMNLILLANILFKVKMLTSLLHLSWRRRRRNNFQNLISTQLRPRVVDLHFFFFFAFSSFPYLLRILVCSLVCMHACMYACMYVNNILYYEYEHRMRAIDSIQTHLDVLPIYWLIKKIRLILVSLLRKTR